MIESWRRYERKEIARSHRYKFTLPVFPCNDTASKITLTRCGPSTWTFRINNKINLFLFFIRLPILSNFIIITKPRLIPVEQRLNGL